MSGSAARLRSLRWLLTVLFTVLNTAGLLVLAVLVVREDVDQGEERVDAHLHRVVAVVGRLVDYGETIDTSKLVADPVDDECPAFAVLPGGAERTFLGHHSKGDCGELDTGLLSRLAAQAVETNSLHRGAVGDLRVRAEPLRTPAGEPVGAVVAAMPMDRVNADHRALVWQVVGGCVVLVLALGVAGHVLSGRAIQPAVAALEQQESLLADTAHDLRTPVAALRALAETALHNPAQQAELLPRTVRLAVRMGAIIDGLLTRARLAAGVEQLQIQPIWLDQLVAGVVDDTPTGGAQVTVTAAPTMVNGDPALLQRAVANLLGNALRYGRQPNAEAIVHITVADGRVTVADHGPGIDAATAEEAFDRFTTTGGSSGLGLSIVRWVAQAHRGSLRVFNADEGGAIFELVLPAVR